MKGLERKMFIIDDSVLIKMISINATENDDAVQILEYLKEMKKNDIPYKAIITLSCFFRAIWVSSEINLQRLKEVIDLIYIFPVSPLDFKDEEKTRIQTINIAKVLHSTASKNESGGDGAC